MREVNQVQFTSLLIELGSVAGRLSYPEIRAELVEALAGRTLSPGYVEFVRDQLAKILDEAEEKRARDGQE